MDKPLRCGADQQTASCWLFQPTGRQQICSELSNVCIQHLISLGCSLQPTLRGFVLNLRPSSSEHQQQDSSSSPPPQKLSSDVPGKSRILFAPCNSQRLLVTSCFLTGHCVSLEFVQQEVLMFKFPIPIHAASPDIPAKDVSSVFGFQLNSVYSNSANLRHASSQGTLQLNRSCNQIDFKFSI